MGLISRFLEGRRKLGAVKESVKGGGTPAKKTTTKRKAGAAESKNLIGKVSDLKDEISQCIQIKDADTSSEGDLAKAENIRKAALLRASFSMLNGVQTLLEEY
jgi:hypothetical protein